MTIHFTVLHRLWIQLISYSRKNTANNDHGIKCASKESFHVTFSDVGIKKSSPVDVHVHLDGKDAHRNTGQTDHYAFNKSLICNEIDQMMIILATNQDELFKKRCHVHASVHCVVRSYCLSTRPKYWIRELITVSGILCILLIAGLMHMFTSKTVWKRYGIPIANV